MTAKKEVIWIALALSIFAILATVAISDVSSFSFFKTAKTDYNVGEEVAIYHDIDFSGANYTLLIENGNSSFLLAGWADNASFAPIEKGMYSIKIFIGPELVQAINITAGYNNSGLILTNRKEYNLGDKVIIYLYNINENDSISVESDDESYNFVGRLRGNLEFSPISAGRYAIKAKNSHGNEYASAAFLVNAPEKTQPGYRIYTDKKTYFPDERVRIGFDISPNNTDWEELMLFVAGEKTIYQLIGTPGNDVYFEPSERGRYSVKIEENGRIVAYSDFEVIGQELMQDDFEINQTRLTAGGRVNIQLALNVSMLNVSCNSIDYVYYNAPAGSFDFIANDSGICHIHSGKTARSFEVMAQETAIDYYFQPDETAVIYFELNKEAEARRSIMDIILGTYPAIERITFYVENHSDDANFNLTGEQISGRGFRITIKNSHNIKRKAYSIVCDASIGNDEIRISKNFVFGYEETSASDESKMRDAGQNEDEGLMIRKYINYSFGAMQDANMHVDFTNIIGGKRDVLELALKKPKLDMLTVFVSGHENDPDFNISMEHAGLDRFLIKVKYNDRIKPDVYRLIAVANHDGLEYTVETLFSWGMVNSSEIARKIINAANEEARKKLDATPEFLYTGKTAYLPGEVAIIYSGANITELKITHGDSVFYLLDFYKNASFAPLSEGLYLVEARTSSVGVLAANFTVEGSITDAAAANIPLNQADAKNSIRLNIRDGWKKGVEYDIKAIRRSARQKYDAGVANGLDGSGHKYENTTFYDIEIMPIGTPVSKISIGGLAVKQNQSADLFIGNVEKGKVGIPVRNIRNSFAIDPAMLDFGNAHITITAKGTMLYKCKEWNFTEQKCYGQWQKAMDITPGKEYNITVDKSDPAFAEVGLITINTAKSIYLPNETAFIGIGVLDHNGNVVCNANVTLEITEPSGTKSALSTMDHSIFVSDECEILGVTNLPDYYSYYTVNGPGEYIMNVSAITYDGEPYMTDNFSVMASVDFDVERQGPTRIYPPVYYNMNFTIKANKNFSGAITERVPRNFSIMPQNGMGISIIGEDKLISWQKDLVEGNEYRVYYRFLAPYISPEIFYLGPLTIGEWQEARIWQIASDAYTLTDDSLTPSASSVIEGQSLTVTGQYDSAGTGSTAGTWTIRLRDQTNSVNIDTDCSDSGADMFMVTNIAWGTGCGPTCTNNGDGTATLSYKNKGNQQVVWTLQACQDSSYSPANLITQLVSGDAATLDATTGNIAITSGNTAPTYSGNQTNDTAVYQGETINLSVRWIDDTALNYSILSTNISGRWVNDTPAAFATNPQNVTSVKWINQSPNNIVGWKMYANDSNNAWNQTGYNTFYVYGMAWNDTAYLNLGTAEAGSANYGYRKITAWGSNTFVSLSCSGNCTIIQSNWTTADMSSETRTARFNCSSAISGRYYANFSLVSLQDGLADNITINCTVSDTRQPNVSLEYPQNNTEWSSSYDVEFNFNVSDFSELANCSLVINSRLNQSNESIIIKDAAGQAITERFYPGNFNWSINCTDTYGNTGSSAFFNITVLSDTGAPSITVASPRNASFTNENPVILEITTNENAVCRYNNSNSSFNYSTGGTLFPTTGGTTHSASLGSLAEGNYAYYIKCNDTYNNINTDADQGVTNFTIDRTFPNVTAVFPANNDVWSPYSINLSWIATDPYIDGNLSCNLTINNNANVSYIASANATRVNFSVYMPNGTYYWNVSCSDNASNTNTSQTMVLTIDGDGPEITAVTSLPAETGTGSSVVITATVSDSKSDVGNVYVNVTLQSAATSYKYLMSPEGGGQYSYTFTDTSEEDTYEYYILAYDDAPPNANSMYSESGQFQIRGVNAALSIQTLNTSYKQNRIINATNSQNFTAYNNGGNATTNTFQEDYLDRKCSDAFSYSCAGTADDTFDGCLAGGADSDYEVQEAYVNDTSVLYTGTVLVSCDIDCGNPGDNVYVYYRNSSSATWRQMLATTCAADGNITTSIGVDDVSGEHQARCIYDKDGNSDDCSESGGSGANTNRYDNDDVNFTVLLADNDGNTDFINYTQAGSANYTKLSDIEVKIQVIAYNSSASVSSSNENPNLEVYLYNGTGFSFSYICNASSLGQLPANCSRKVVDVSILDAWKDSNNRKMRVRGINLDYSQDLMVSDLINWSSVYTKFATPSKIENYGIVNISARLIMRAEHYNASTGQWGTASIIYNQSLNISINQSIDISAFWNQENFTSDTRPLGRYRAYAALIGSSGNTLQNEDGSYINDTYHFNITYLKIYIDSPSNGSTADATGYFVNATLDNTYYQSNGWCGYSLDRQQNITMANDSTVHFYNMAFNSTEGSHNITVYCNDTTGDTTYETAQFNAVDQSAPNVSLYYPPNGQDGLPTTVTFRYNVSDIVANIKNCSIFIDNTYQASNTSITESEDINFIISGLEEIRHDWRIECYDNSSQINLGASDTWEFLVGTDNEPPYIFLGNPANNTVTTNNDVTFYFGVYDEKSYIANCSLLFNNAVNQTKQTAEIIESFNNDDNSFTANELPLGQYNWSINCTDDSSSANSRLSEFRNITIINDTDFPIITLAYPAAGSVITSSTISFQYNATDTSANIINCSLIINSTINKTVASPAEGQINTITPDSSFNEGFYNWSVECTDDSYQTNKNMSGARNFTLVILGDLKAGLSTDMFTYEQGSQANDTISITANISDAYFNPINGTQTVDIITGNTSLRWWNESWKRRKPILLSELTGNYRKNITVWVNLTGLSGISSCQNEIRVVENYSITLNEVPSKAMRGDDSSYCEFVFNANITANAIGENYYYAYYDNPAASEKDYGMGFNQSTYLTAGSGALSGTYASSAGTYISTSANDNSYWAFGSTDGTNVNAYAFIIFNLSKANISEDRLTKMTFNVTYCHSGEDATADCDGDDPIEGLIDEDQNAEIFDYASGTWVDIGNLNTNNNELEVNSSFSISNNISRYVNDSSREAKVRYELDWNATGHNPDIWLVIDRAIAAVEYDAQIYTSSTGQEYELINRSRNDTGSDGSFWFSITSGGIAQGWYSAVSYAVASGYNSAINYTVFRVTRDNTAPSVYLSWPYDGYPSPTNNITFTYNVTDALSGVPNCSLILNNTLNSTNNTITEGSRQNFTLYAVPNGNYIWTVNCTDDFNNTGTYPQQWDFSIELDTQGPAISIVLPENGWNDTNGNLTLIFNASDSYSNIANCSLVINESVNQTIFNVQESTRLNFTVNNTAEGFYTWYINCTDSSSGANTDSSEKRNLTVVLDYSVPEIRIISPALIAQSTTGNVSFIFNVTDAISAVRNCSLTINGTVNQTNSSIDENVLQNFTVYNLPTGFYVWNITCADDSENINENTTWPARNLTVATDTQGPEINPEFPPIDAQLIDTDIIFRYNVTDLASDISNCSLIINSTVNQTNITVSEGASNNFTVGGFNFGVYNWSVNCTDNAANPNTASSGHRLVTIGTDTTPPDITLEWPENYNHNDTNGNVTFLFRVNDLASGIANCSVVLDGVLNSTNSSTILEATSGQEITIGGMQNGSHSWSVNCTDTYGNTGNSTVRSFNVILDYDGPFIQLISPANASVDSDGSIVFFFNVSDEISAVSNCSLVINSRLNMSNSTIAENARQNFTLSGLTDGEYNWSINCSDSSDTRNTNQSETRNATVAIDTGAPEVELILPANNTMDADGYRTFYYNVTDELSNISSCSLVFNGVVVQVNGTITKNTPQNFTRGGIANGQYNWSVSCTDSSDYLNINSSGYRNLTVLIDSEAPAINLTLPLNFTQDVDNNVTFFFNVSDIYPITGCSLVINGTVNKTNDSITRGAILNFTLNYMPNGTFEWGINCTDGTEFNYVGASQRRIIAVGPDTDAPDVQPLWPPNYIVDPDGIITFAYNATDFASDIANCSIVLNNTVNMTNYTVFEGAKQNFTVTGFNNGFYEWYVNCTDNSTAHNTGKSDTRYFEIGIDETPPVVNLSMPLNNSRLTYRDVMFFFIVNDLSSDISNCSLLINGITNQTNVTLLTEGAVQNFTINNMPQSDYNWSVSCVDNSVHPNTGNSVYFNLSVKLKDIIYVNISTNKSSYEKGETALVTTNVTDNETAPLFTSLSIDIIKGNATAGWWNTTWKYRIPVEINTSNMTRTNRLVELRVNFTEVIEDELGSTGSALDNRSVRVVEWKENSSHEIPSQAIMPEEYDSRYDALMDVLFIMNSTVAQNTTKNYYIYFDTAQRPKQAGAYEMPAYSLSGSSQNVTFNGTNMSIGKITISHGEHKMSMQLDSGDTIPNFDYVDKAGAGGIYNITVKNTMLTNPNSIIAPMAVRLNDYLQQNGTAKVEIGPVATKVNIPANISTVANSDAELNYTIWFGENEIYVIADLYAYFGSNEEAPSVRFQNEWFSYLLQNQSNWENYLYKAESETKNRTHYFNKPALSGLDETYQSAWYMEYGANKGSINVIAEHFRKDSIDKRRVMIFDDGYSVPPESDSVGFNYDEAQIYAPATYSIRVWMIFSNVTNSARAVEMEKEFSSPMNITLKPAEQLMNRTEGYPSEGVFRTNWSTINMSSGWYSAVALANLTYYYNGFDYSFFEVTRDLIAPIITAGSPEGWLSYKNVTFNYYVSENNLVLDNCSLVINNAANISNASAANEQWNNFKLDNMAEMAYNWSVNCTDSEGNPGNSSPKLIYVDASMPSLNITHPNNSVTLNYTLVDFNFTAADNLAPNISCHLTLNGIMNSSINTTSGAAANITINLSQGQYSWNITCQDIAGNANTSATRSLIIDLWPPAVNPISPVAPNNWLNTPNVTFVYVPEDSSAITNCSIIIDGILNSTNTSINRSINNNFTVKNISEGMHTWMVNCSDSGGSVGSSTAGEFYVDTAPPRVNLTWPYWGYTSASSSISLNFTAVDMLDSTLDCNVSINNIVNNSQVLHADNNTNVTYNASGFLDAAFYWNVTCIDNAGNLNASDYRLFYVAEPPSVVLGSPANSTRTSMTSQSFFYTPYDNSRQIANCTLALNNKANATNRSINEMAQNSINISGMPHGEYNWSINCTDNSGITDINESYKVIYIDTMPPAITQIRPAAVQAFVTDDIEFNFSATDQFGFAVNIQCNLSLDGMVNLSFINLTSGGYNESVIENLNLGRHNWSVTCKDDLNNTNSTANITFIVQAPDVYTNDTFIRFNNTNPKENDSVLINATLQNIGGVPALNFNVTFFDNGPNGIMPIGNATVEQLDSQSNISLGIVWNVTLGFHTIYVFADYKGEELSTANNGGYNNLSTLVAAVLQPANGTWTANSTNIINFTVQDYANNSLNYTLYVDGRFNRTANITDNESVNAELNLSEGAHYITIEGFGPRVDVHGAEGNLTRKQNSTEIYIIVDKTEPITSFITLNMTWSIDNTPEIRFNITDNLDNVLNYSLYINNAFNMTNFTGNGTFTGINLSQLGDGEYNLTIEALDNAGNRENSSFIVIYIDTTPPAPRILTLNLSNFTDSTPEMHFNISDNMAPSLNFTFYVDSAESASGNATNGVDRNINLTTLADGYRTVILEAMDLAGNRANSSFIGINIDTTAPTITIENPGEGEALGYMIDILATVNDNFIGVGSVWYTIKNASFTYLKNGTLNATTNFDDLWNSSVDVGENTEFMAVNLTVYANDTFGNMNNLSRVFFVDNKKPSINFVVPGGHDFNGNFNLDIRVQNRNLTTSTYNITNSTGSLKGNNTNTSINLAQFNWTELIDISGTSAYPEGVYNMAVMAVDSVGNNRTSTNYFRIDRTAPTVLSNFSGDLYNTTSLELQFNFTAIDLWNSYLMCNLTIDSSIIAANINATNSTITNVTAAIDEGRHSWNITCWDKAGNANSSQKRNFTIDRTAPAVRLERPANGSFNSSALMTFYYTPYDNLTNIMNCSLVIDGKANQTNNSVANGLENNFTAWGISEGMHEWSVNCTDNTGNTGTNMSAMALYMDYTAPNATFTTNNGTWFNEPAPGIFFSIMDNLDSSLNYTIYVDNEPDLAGYAANGTVAQRNPSAMPNGTHQIIIESWDNAYNRRNTTNLTIVIDTVLPNITLFNPLNSSNVTESLMEFSFNATDNLDSELLCNITLDSIANVSMLAAPSGENTSHTINGYALGYHNWSVTCMDNATNTFTSETYYFNYTPPDMEVSEMDLAFNTTEFEEGKNFTIFANITNIGRSRAENVVVEFFSGDPAYGGMLLHNYTLNFSASQNRTVNMSLALGIGTTHIFVQADRQNAVLEISEYNNKANRSINISAYNIIFGNITGSLVLGSSENQTVFSWLAGNSTQGNIFAVDSDSGITWTNLSAIGVNTTYGNASNDFADIDAALNMTNLTDSINRTYTLNGMPKAVMDYVIYMTVINTTPIVNSTNTSYFVSGIFWDMSDANNGQYNGSQDIVFASQINRQKNGLYGLYDFEMRVPARLRQYRQPNYENTVTFYVELT